MRISDWSSDVCSSDLPGLTVRPFTGPLAGQTITAELYYKPEYWRTNRYFEWQDKLWHATDRTGHVDVGDVQKVQDKAEPDQTSSVRQPAPSQSRPVQAPARLPDTSPCNPLPSHFPRATTHETNPKTTPPR